jgi:hypothetical protein
MFVRWSGGLLKKLVRSTGKVLREFRRPELTKAAKLLAVDTDNGVGG